MGKKPSLLLLLAIPIVLLRTAMAEEPPPRLLDFSGQSIALTKVQRDATLIAFWMVSCVPCLEEMPLLDAMYKKYKAMGFTLIGVNVEPDSKAAEEFLKKLPVSFPVAFDAESKVSQLYNVQGMPSTVIVDRKGNARVLHKGYRPGDENTYLDHVRTLIRE